MLTTGQLEGFARDGFVKVAGAVAPTIADECAARLWAEIPARPGEPDTWTEPVYWIQGMAGGPFEAAANTTALREAYDQIVGVGRWAPRTGLGAFPLRFPHDVEPDDAGWHIDTSFRDSDDSPYRANVYSRERALLMLFLFSEVGERDAPTRIRIGSHMDVPALLAPYGERGVESPDVDRLTAGRPTALATGSSGDVYLCHPFLVHAAQPHHGTTPRFMAQPPLYLREPLRIETGTTLLERTVRDALVAPYPTMIG